MKRALFTGYAVILFLQGLITLIQIFERYTDAYFSMFVQNCFVGFNVCGLLLYVIGLRLTGTQWGSHDDPTAFAISGALNLVCLLIFYRLFIWYVAGVRSARKDQEKPA